MPEFYIIIARKKIFRTFGGHVPPPPPPPCPPSPTPTSADTTITTTTVTATAAAAAMTMMFSSPGWCLDLLQIRPKSTHLCQSW